jgi:hypothetical protein
MRRSMIPAVTAAAVLAVVAGTAVVRNGATDGTARPSAARRLPPLLMPGRSGEGVAGAAAVGAPDAPVGSAGRYLLRGTLPEPPADDVQAYRLPWREATRDHAMTVARALGMSGQPTRTDSGWTLVADGRTLYVSDGPGVPWSVYAGDACGGTEPALPAPPARVEIDPAEPQPGKPQAGQPEPGQPVPVEPCGGAGGAVSAPGVAVAVCPDDVVTPRAGGKPGKQPQSQRLHCDEVPLPHRPPQPSKDEAMSVARDVLAALGTGRDAVLTITDGWVGRTVVATPRVDGLGVQGWETFITVDAHRQVVGGNGWLTEPVRAERFPVISAQQAFDALPEMPQILVCEQVKGDDGCAPAPDIVITGASLGLLQVPSTEPRGAAYLLPAWIFTPLGGGQGIPVVAVPERFWPEPAPQPKPLEPPGGVPVPEPGSGGCAVEERPVSSDGSTGAVSQCDPGATGGGQAGSSGGSPRSDD